MVIPLVEKIKCKQKIQCYGNQYLDRPYNDNYHYHVFFPHNFTSELSSCIICFTFGPNVDHNSKTNDFITWSKSSFPIRTLCIKVKN